MDKLTFCPMGHVFVYWGKRITGRPNNDMAAWVCRMSSGLMCVHSFNSSSIVFTLFHSFVLKNNNGGRQRGLPEKRL